ncbi:cupin domain-containing protein [Pseudomonas fluorescens]|uniref:cupin domain-containing protein n=1 Tax=Pseudomonas fluorescens TaxID=294 RepID=UPI00130E5175|nr:cupin domain-containing protein [Pseudomonas fluorescens]
MSNKSVNDVVGFSRSDVEPTEDKINHPDVLSGEYTAKTWLHFSDESRSFISGVWEAEACEENFTSEQTEFCHILDGYVRLTDRRGISVNYGPGESFVIPAGFSGTWQNVGTVRKLFVIA